MDDAKVTDPPVPVEALARSLGARLSFEPFDAQMSGMLYRDGTHTVIGVNSAHANTRQRFTIAHEVGHLLLHEGRPMFVDRSVRVDHRDSTAALGSDQEEIEANAFAAALLMPEKMLWNAIVREERRQPSAQDEEFIQRLAERFDVSVQAMEIRLTTLGVVVPR